MQFNHLLRAEVHPGWQEPEPSQLGRMRRRRPSRGREQLDRTLFLPSDLSPPPELLSFWGKLKTRTVAQDCPDLP